MDALDVWGDRVLVDARRLWDSTTRTEIAQLPWTEMRAGLLLTPTNTALEVRSAVDASLIATMAGAGTLKSGIAIDGSYVWAYVNSTLSAWTPSSVSLVSLPITTVGNVFAAPGELRVSGTPAGANVIQFVPVDGSPTTTSAVFTGNFQTWFEDGDHFITHESSTSGGGVLRIYSKDAVQKVLKPATTLVGLGGTRKFYWVGVEIFDLTQPFAPAVATLPGGAVSGASEHGAVWVSGPTKDVSVVDLDGLAPTISTETPALPTAATIGAYDDAGRWVVGNGWGAAYQNGTVADPAASGSLGCGKPVGIAGAADGRVAVSVAAGRILVFDVEQATPQLVSAIPFAGWRLRISTDGDTLAAFPFLGVDTPTPGSIDIHVFDVASATQTAVSGPGAIDFDMSANGQFIGSGGFRGQTDASSWTLLKTEEEGTFLSPSGQHTAISTAYSQEGCGFTYFFDGTMTVNAVQGCAVGWLDDDHLLVQEWEPGTEYPAFCAVHTASYLYDAQGTLLGVVPVEGIPSISRWSGLYCPNNTFDGGMQALSPSTAYLPGKNTIVDVYTGTTLSSHPVGVDKSAVAGSHFVYTCGESFVCADPI